MELYLFRHGIAEPIGAREEVDRELTEGGREKTRRVAKAIKALGLTFDLILSSPLVRARQTAGILADELGMRKEMEISPALVYSEPYDLLVKVLNDKYADRNSVVLVGHEPYLSGLISLLISGSASLDITMKKAGLARLTVDELVAGRCATLDWLIPPKVLAKLV